MSHLNQTNHNPTIARRFHSRMNPNQSLDMFIVRLAKKIAVLYPSNCADEEDYIQAGHLKLAEMDGDTHDKRDFRAYAVISIARAMREAALGAMGATSAPERVKRRVHLVKLLIASGMTEQDICSELNIEANALADLKSLISTKSWHRLFDEPSLTPKPFCVIEDILSSYGLTEEDRVFLIAQFDDNLEILGLTRKQKWTHVQKLRSKLIRSGYGE